MSIAEWSSLNERWPFALHSSPNWRAFVFAIDYRKGLDNLTENRYFYCYSPRLHDFLQARGHDHITVSRHFRTGRKYWVYERTEALASALAAYGKRRGTVTRGE